MQIYYQAVFLLSFVLTGVYLLIWRKHFDVHLTLVFILVPITNLAFLMQAQARTTETALAATRFAYLGGCFLQLIIMMTVFALCSIPVSRWLRFVFAGISAVVFLSVQTIGRGPMFYKSAELQQAGDHVDESGDAGVGEEASGGAKPGRPVGGGPPALGVPGDLRLDSLDALVEDLQRGIVRQAVAQHDDQPLRNQLGDSKR